MRIASTALIILMIHIRLLETRQQKKDLIIHKHGRKLNHFFKKMDTHLSSRYPVVCRWRDDLYFTIASIVDFQRVMGSKVVFEFPANPLVVPQTCLRFQRFGKCWCYWTTFFKLLYDWTT